jgi:hypothetical protein
METEGNKVEIFRNESSIYSEVTSAVMLQR